MNKSYFSLRNLMTVALLLFGSVVAFADAPVSGKVVGVDQSAHTFTVQWIGTNTRHHFTAGHQTESRERTYKTSDKTTYLVGSGKGSWANVTKGATVHVASHGGVADTVQIGS
jgi:hypothetical protein